MLIIGDKITRKISARVTDEYDVVVCGGGTAGCVAALAAARNGAKTLLIESSSSLGGMMTEGNAGLTKFIQHARTGEIHREIMQEFKEAPKKVLTTGGIALELVHKLIERKDAVGTMGSAGSYVYTDSQELKLLLFEELWNAGVTIHLHSHVFDVVKENDRIIGVTYLTKEGFLVVKGKYFIDATGDADLSAAAGAEYAFGSCKEDDSVKEGLIDVGKFTSMGSMYRIGGVDFEKLMAFIKEKPDMFEIHPYGMVPVEDVESEYKKGDMIIVRGFFKGEKYHTELGFEKQPEKDSFFQIYNYPRKGVAVGCVNYTLTKDLNGMTVEGMTRGEYEILYGAKRQLARFREEIGGFENAFLIDVPVRVRESRHVVGEYKLSINDILEDVEFEDVIGRSAHPADIGPQPKAWKEWKRPDRFSFSMPYRILVAKGIDNLLLAGRLVSNTREAAGCTRPTVPCMITGEAAGTAAALCNKFGVELVKNLESKVLREQLEAQGVCL